MFDLTTIHVNPENPFPAKSETEFQDLVDKIKKFPKFLKYRPIIYDPEKRVILGGNKRYQALVSLGYTEVNNEWVRSADELSEEEKKNFIYADNKNYGEYEIDFVDDDMAEEWGIDFDDPEEPEDPVKNDDGFVASSSINTDIVRGDLFEFVKGSMRHKLLCGDSTDVEDVRKVMGGATIKLIITDPPYGVAYVGKTKESLTIENDSMSEDETILLWRDTISAFVPFWGKGASIYVTTPSGPISIGFALALHEMKILRQKLVWNKSSMVMGRSDYHYKHEPILYGWNPNGTHYFTNDRTKTSVLDHDKPSRNADHPTMKPVSLWVELICNSSKRGWNVFDPFSGSATTLVACHKNSHAIEISERYCQVGVDRMLLLDPLIQVFKNGEDVTEFYRKELESKTAVK